MAARNFDDVLLKVGEYGPYQKRIMFLMWVTCGCVYLQNLSPVFTMKIPRHRCKIPGLENDTFEIQNSRHATAVNLSIPVDEDGAYSSCSMYDVSNGHDAISGNTSEVPCDDWVYDMSVFKSTYVTELNLVCQNRHYRSHSTMLIFAGKFFGAFINSVAGDHFGRRRVYMVMLLAMTATGVALMFVSSLPVLMVLRFLAGATTTGCYLPTYVIAMEMVGISHRRAVGLWATIGGVVFALMAGGFAFFLRDWASFQASLVAPCLILLIGVFFLPESARWLLSKGRLQETQKIVDEMAKSNGVRVSPQLYSEAFIVKDNSQVNEVSATRITPLRLFLVPRLAVRYTLLYFSWILLIMCLYGLKLNVSNMKGNIFLNHTLMNLVEVVSIVLFVLLLERMGRRLFILGAALVGGLACLSTILPTVLGGSDWILRGLSFAGMIGVRGAMSAIYVMSPELFPTVLRSFGLGSCSMISRIGGLASPYVADLNVFVTGVWGPALPQIVFGLSGLVTAIMIFFMPETKGSAMPETVRDAEVMGSSQSKQLPDQKEMIIVQTLVEQDKEESSSAANVKMEVYTGASLDVRRQ